ncbi:glucosamine-6-phosphate deaminase [Solibacillus sp. FSL H8-0538]|uniref:glucosamine-6-phosphate deaminase n=1 Tax=Solibacillus sp. FSL H8-0538 TaxID=2921400 RepID=UPI0030F8F0C4
MNSFKWIEAKSYNDMSRLGAELFIQQLQEKPASVLGLATGGTPEGLYEELVRNYNDGKITFEQAVTFNLDEYVGVPVTNKGSYHYYMDEQLFQHVNMQSNNINIPNGNVTDLNASAEAYEALIQEAGGIDLQLLGIGVNGHIGFNEPSTSFTSTTHIVELTSSTREANQIYFEQPKDVPTHAITMGIQTIVQAKKIVVLISGASKQEAYDRLRSGDISEDFPASALHMHSDVTVIFTDIRNTQFSQE